MGNIQPFSRNDVARVAELHYQVFSGKEGSGPQPLPKGLSQSYQNYLEETFLSNPWVDEEITSLVYKDTDGAIIGFIGAMPRRMSFQGRPIKVALSSQFIVAPDRRSTGAALKLTKAFLSGPQDLSLTDEANEGSVKIWEAFGAEVALLYSTKWTRLLRPAKYAASLLENAGLWPALISAAGPICNLTDAVLARKFPRRFQVAEPKSRCVELDEEALLNCISEFREPQALWPEYDIDSLRWLLRVVSQKSDWGTLRKSAVLNSKDEVIGWYIYFAKPGGMSTAMQVYARKNSMGEVLDSLFYDARLNDSVAVSGRIEPKFMQSFVEKKCMFDCGAQWMLVHSKNREVLNSIALGNAFLSKLEGEWCMRFR